ncbi:MAG TPA: nucleotidyltransferase domain-containing protein [Clostridia bacterium]|nr:nucleotidyltransferase domain-containing protein [Clostridia bacterium]
MYLHQEETLKNASEKLKTRDDVLGLLVAGSVAHGFASETSDVDIMILISDENYNARLKSGEMTYYETESSTYKGGYVDGKYICKGFMKKVAESGSEPARFAFDGSKVVFSKIEGIEELIEKIVRYPVERKQENIKRFRGQLEAWRWYCNEALSKSNEYLLNLAISNLVLFGGRMLLANNETLYPYHKWFLKVLESMENKPENIMKLIENIYASKDAASVDAFYKSVTDFVPFEMDGFNWPNQFARDTELTWMSGWTQVSDI